MPILEGLDGVRKMSKSYGNYVAFNDAPGDQFGKVMSIPDALMPKYFELLTDLDYASVQGLHPRDAKVLLAKNLTAVFAKPIAAAMTKTASTSGYRTSAASCMTRSSGTRCCAPWSSRSRMWA